MIGSLINKTTNVALLDIITTYTYVLTETTRMLPGLYIYLVYTTSLSVIPTKRLVEHVTSMYVHIQACPPNYNS